MDGYALSSKATKHASAETPISFPVGGLIAAGSQPVLNVAETDDQLLSCVKIMTGARFPHASETGDVELDCCVKFEDVRGPGMQRLGVFPRISAASIDCFAGTPVILSMISGVYSMTSF